MKEGRSFLGAPLPAFAGLLPAQSYPAQPMRPVACWSPGGALGTIGRTIAQPLSLRLGQSTTVDGRAGACGNIGAKLDGRE